MTSSSDPRIKAVADILSVGIADLVAKCIDAFNGVPPPPPGYVAPEQSAIRRQNIRSEKPTQTYSSVGLAFSPCFAEAACPTDFAVGYWRRTLHRLTPRNSVRDFLG